MTDPEVVALLKEDAEIRGRRAPVVPLRPFEDARVLTAEEVADIRRWVDVHERLRQLDGAPFR